MNTDGKIYITISDRANGSNNQNGGSSEGSIAKKFGLVEHATKNFVLGNARTILNYGINHYGDFTGDYQTQRDISSLMSIANKVVGIGTAFLTGGELAGSIALATTVVNTALDIKTMLVEQNKTDYNINQLRKISGLNNNSRGTEN